MRNGKTLRNFPPMPISVGPSEGEAWEDVPANFLLAEQLDYNVEELKRMVEENCQKFNQEQTGVFNAAMQSVENNYGKIIFIHSAGEGGKTFVCNTFAAAVRSNGDIVLCVASSGIAALLLHGGQTAHSRLKIPIPALADSVATIKPNSDLHEMLK